MSRPLSSRQASTAERLRYLELGLGVDAALEEAIRLLRIVACQEHLRSDVRRARGALGRLERAWREVRADLLAYVWGDLRVRVPDARAGREIRGRASLLASLTPAVPPAVILTLADDLLEHWTRTRVDGPALPDSAGRDEDSEDSRSVETISGR